MTATRMRALGRVATLTAFAGAWAAAAYFLWASSSVPDGLRLPSLDEHRYFSDRTLDHAGDFARFERWNFVLAQLALVGTLVYYAFRGERFTRESAAGRVGTGILLGMLGFAIVWLVQMPFKVADYWWQRRHGLARGGSLPEFILGDWLLLGAVFLSLSLTLAIVMGLAGVLGRHWWIAGAPVFVGIGALVLFVAPYLSDLRRLRDPEVARQARLLAAKEGVPDVPVRVEKVSDRTRAINAYAFGLGPSRRVVLWDTLLDGRLPKGAVRVVIAHEYGHHTRDHVPKGLAWYALFAFPGAFLIERLTRRKGGMRNPAAVPRSLLVLVVLQFAALPLQNVISRHMEAEADWVALEATRDSRSATRLFQDFTRIDLAEPDPPTWSHALFGSHPTIMERIAMIEAWRLRPRAPLAVPVVRPRDSLARPSAVTGRHLPKATHAPTNRRAAAPRGGSGSLRSSSISTRSPGSRRGAPS